MYSMGQWHENLKIVYLQGSSKSRLLLFVGLLAQDFQPNHHTYIICGCKLKFVEKKNANFLLVAFALTSRMGGTPVLVLSLVNAHDLFRQKQNKQIFSALPKSPIG